MSGDLVDENLVKAGFDLLHAELDPVPIPIYDGLVPNPLPPPPYLLVYTSIERPADAPTNNATGQSDTWSVRWYLHCVGGSAAGARAVAMRARAALLGKRPVVAGRNCGLISQEADNPPTRDESTGSPFMDAVVVYRVLTTPG